MKHRLTGVAVSAAFALLAPAAIAQVSKEQLKVPRGRRVLSAAEVILRRSAKE